MPGPCRPISSASTCAGPTSWSWCARVSTTRCGTAYQQISEVWHERDDVDDLRTAAYLVAIDKVAASYRALGL